MEDNNTNAVRNDEVTKEYGFVEYLQILLNKRKILIISTISAGILSVIFALFIVKPVFLSTGSVKGSSQVMGLGGMLSSAGIPDLGGLESLTGSSSKELAVYIEILNSRRCIEETIIQFNLMEVYDAKYMQDLIKSFREDIMVLSGNRQSGILSIGVYDENPERAKDIASYLIDQLNKINTEMSIQDAKNNKDFIESRYKEVGINLKNAEDSLRIFQDVYGFAPDLVTQSIVQADIKLEAEIKAEEIKLDILRKILSPNEAEIKIQEEKINAMYGQLNNIRSGTDGSSSFQLKGSPEKVLNYFRLRRNVEIQNKILTTLIPLLEQARIEEKRETPTVIVLDQPNYPERKAKPKRSLIVLGSMILVFAFLSSYFILYETFLKKITNKLSRVVK